ncbi:MAG: glycosyltransferase, partial [Chloroflexi bacterium]|nr:glycosyltransferase [Chloroflexota bacterium]
MTKVTVAIASYNMANYLPAAIDSALAQDHDD